MNVKTFNVKDNLLTKLDIYGGFYFSRKIYFYNNMISFIIVYDSANSFSFQYYQFVIKT